MSGENVSSDSKKRASFSSNEKTDVIGDSKNKSYTQPLLTELLLHKHNEDMEKLMIQKHKELRSSTKNVEKHKEARAAQGTGKSLNKSKLKSNLNCRGAKRSRNSENPKVSWKIIFSWSIFIITK